MFSSGLIPLFSFDHSIFIPERRIILTNSIDTSGRLASSAILEATCLCIQQFQFPFFNVEDLNHLYYSYSLTRDVCSDSNLSVSLFLTPLLVHQKHACLFHSKHAGSKSCYDQCPSTMRVFFKYHTQELPGYITKNNILLSATKYCYVVFLTLCI